MCEKYFSLLLLSTGFLLLKSVGAQDLATAENGVGNSNLQARLSTYYQAMQSLPFHGAHTNLHNQPGYNYITPASTYAGYSTSKHATQTAPLAISIHPDDYTKFDKTEETYFIPRAKSLVPTSRVKSQPNFYISRTTPQRNTAQLKNIETTPASDNVTLAQTDLVQTTTEAIQYQPDPNVRVQQQETQQKWKPLPLQQNYENSLNSLNRQAISNLGSTYQIEPTNPDIYQFNQGVSNYPGTNFTTVHPYFLNQALPIGCQRHSLNAENFETGLRPLSSPQSQGASHITQFPRQRIPLAENARNFPTSSSVNALNHERLTIIKSLLAEYLALTQSNAPNIAQKAQVDLNNDQNIVDNRFSTDAQAFQFSAYSPTRLPSPAVNKFIDTNQHQSQPYYQARPTIPTIPAIRHPHSVYGAPFVDSLSSVSDKGNGEIS